MTIVGSKVIGTPTLGLRGLRLWLSFNEGSGSTAYDSSFYNNHGTIVGAVWTDGKFGKALYYDGVDDYTEVLWNNSIALVNNFTWAVWFKTEDPSYNQFIMSFYGERFAIRIRNGVISIRDYLNNDNINGQTKIQAGKWYFVAVTKSSTEGVKIYLNATLDGSCSSCTSNTELVTGKSLWFGMDQWYYENGWDDWFIGIIDEPRIYARVLSDYEIQLLYYNRIGAVSSKTI